MAEKKVNLKCFTRKNGRAYTLKDNKDRFFFPVEYMKMFDKLKKKQQHTITCLINTGARINEMRHVQVSDLDLVNNRIVLRVTKTKARKKEKKGRIRTIPISAQFTKYLKRYIDKHKLDFNSYLNIHSTPAINIGLKKACRLVKLQHPEDFSAHTFRKTLEVWLMALGVDGLALTAHLGHDIRTAAQHYVSPDIFNWEEKQKMREIIGDLYSK
jgi:integrase